MKIQLLTLKTLRPRLRLKLKMLTPRLRNTRRGLRKLLPRRRLPRKRSARFRRKLSARSVNRRPLRPTLRGSVRRQNVQPMIY